MEWIDTHCHLNEDAFSPDLADVVQRAEQSGVTRMLVVGIDLASSRRAVELAERFPSVFAVVGIQPNYVQSAGANDLSAIEELSRSPRVVAIGETGLDRYWDFAPLDQQIAAFEQHIELARQRDLPLVVHCREAEADVLTVLRRAAGAAELAGVMHSFSGDLATATECVALGLHISFAGMLTFKRNDALRSVAAALPAERLLLETDAPYLAPAPYRGKRNEPAYLPFTGACLAEVRKAPTETVAAVTTANARRLFRLP
uniref:TatD family deoxyribonuclease n=1 Tax=Schlesneria paludicola TaxID=360056 RepID=A0A7C4QRC9_9PLAN